MYLHQKNLKQLVFNKNHHHFYLYIVCILYFIYFLFPNYFIGDDGNCEVWQFESISHLTSNEKTPLHKVHSSLPFSTKSISMFPISTFVFGVAGETKDGKGLY